MFAIGFLAHSLLLPFISIFIQILVVNVCLKTPSEISSGVRTTEHHVNVTSFHSSLDGSSASYHFGDYFAEESLCKKVVQPTVSPLLSLPFGEVDDASLGVFVSVNHLRGPPVTIC